MDLENGFLGVDYLQLTSKKLKLFNFVILHFSDGPKNLCYKYVKQGFFLNKLLEMMRSVYFPSVLSATVVQISDIKVQQKVYQT